MKLFLLGGRPCSGKTTLASRIGKKYSITVDYLDVFAQRCINNSDEDNPNIFRWKNRDLIDVLHKEPMELFFDYLNMYEEMLPFLFEHINSIKKDIVILEGSILMPKFLSQFKEKYEIKVCYLLTDDSFVRERYVKRDYVLEMLKKNTGKKALDNLLERDSIFAKYLVDEIKEFNLPKINIDENISIEDTLKIIEDVLKI
jgi:2-phosphoglycerate kinase